MIEPVTSRSYHSTPVGTDNTNLRLARLEQGYESLLSGPNNQASYLLSSGWSQYNNGWDQLRIGRLNSFVSITGMLQGGTGTVFSLPTGYRPTGALIFPCYSSAGMIRVDIAANGTVSVGSTSGAWVSFSGIVFQAAL